MSLLADGQDTPALPQLPSQLWAHLALRGWRGLEGTGEKGQSVAHLVPFRGPPYHLDFLEQALSKHLLN